MTLQFSTAQTDQAASSSAAVAWIEQVLVGPLGTSLAVIAVAWCGFGMLAGRVSARRGVMVVLGCFVLFGAPALARMLIDLVPSSGAVGVSVTPQQNAAPPAPQPVMPPPYDPYAGASVPGSGH